MLLTRTLNLSIYPNYNKLEHLRYVSHKFKQLTQIFCNKLFINTKRFLSTEGMGVLANQAQHKAISVLNAQKAATKVIKAKTKNKERQRQNHKSKSIKTEVKQLLDIEARKIVTRCHNYGTSLVLEDSKVLANLKPRKSISNWAKAYFSERVTQLAQEYSVFVLKVHPKNTSITCSCCGHISKKSREGRAFVCVSCGFTQNADLNAAHNLAMKGHPILNKILHKYADYYLKGKVG